MPIIDLVDIDNASDEVKEAVKKHLDKGYTITNEKRTLLHNVPAFEALEVKSYEMSKERQIFLSMQSLLKTIALCAQHFIKSTWNQSDLILTIPIIQRKKNLSLNMQERL